HSLSDHAAYLSNKIQFLLDAMLGVVTIEQNNVIKIFSVAAVALMPPTLIASIYGMNFKHMPELDSQLGYPVAIVLMLLAPALPYFVLKCKKWLCTDSTGHGRRRPPPSSVLSSSDVLAPVDVNFGAVHVRRGVGA